MIIGVASVILVGSAIDGLGVYAEQSTAKAFGTESYLVAQVASVGNMSRREYFDRLRSNRPITIDEFRFLRTVTRIIRFTVRTGRTPSISSGTT